MRESDQQGTRAALVTGIFAVLAAMITGFCMLANTYLERSSEQILPSTLNGSTISESTISESAVAPPPLPVDICPQVSGMFWMQIPNQWYGTETDFGGYYLAWERTGGFYVWDPLYGELQHPDPFAQMQRNTWLRLPNSPFNVCVDSQLGNVFGQYAP